MQQQLVTQLVLNVPGGSVSLSLPSEIIEALQKALQGLMATLRARAQEGGAATLQRSFEYQHRGEVFLEVFCNPNIWASPHNAKVLITARDEKLRLSLEADLTQTLADIEQAIQG